MMDLSKFALRLMVRVDDGMAFLASVGGWLQRAWEGMFAFLHGILARDSSDHIGAWIGKAWTLFWLPLGLFVAAGARLFQRIHERIRNNPVSFQVVERPISALIVFLSSLYFSRPYQLRLAIPVFGFAMLLTGLVISSFNLFDNSRISQRYAVEIDLALSNNQFERVRLFQDKLAQLGVKSQQFHLQTIKTMAEQGKMDEAIAWAEKIAPLEQPGFAAAHYWLAIHYLNDPSESASDSALTAERHLDHVVGLYRRNGNGSDVPAEIEYLQANVLLKRNRIDEGLAQLENISVDFWPATVLCLELNQALNREQGLVDSAECLLRQARKQPEILSQLNADCFAIWCEALMQTPGSEAWIEVADLWLTQIPGDRRGLAIWVPLQFEKLDGMIQSSDIGRASDLLNKIGNSIGVDNRKLLADWIFQKSSGSIDERRFFDRLSEKLVADAEASEKRSGVLLEILGTAAILQGNEVLAISLLKKGLELEPNNAIAWNNLAFLTSKNTPERIEDALLAANRAVELDMQNVNIRLTRGMLAIASKQWSLAADDLEFVNQFRRDDGAIHRNLAVAFGHLGNREKENLHRVLAGE